MCKGVCLRFGMWIKAVYELPKKFTSEEAKKTISEVWEKIFGYNQNWKGEN